MKKFLVLCLLALGQLNIAYGTTAVKEEVKEPSVPKAKKVVVSTPTVITTTTTTTTTTIVKPKNKINEKNVELVFVVDTTGSMGGLISGAKTKIWSIINDIMQNQSKGTKVRVGLVAYRDKEDDYVTKITGLSEDLDQVYSTLMDFQAQGGGDEPEDVRKALFEGVNSMQWSKSSSNLSKIIFLVGDARPHTDYNDYPTTVETAKKAKKNGIIINTIQCGNLPRTDKYWREIAQYGGGEYFAIPQTGGTVEIRTPYDEELSALSVNLDRKYIPYGAAPKRAEAIVVKEAVTEKMSSSGVSVEAKASRAINKSMNKYSYSKDDLIQGIENAKIKLSDIKKEDLPDNMQNMTMKEREEYVQKMIQERKEIKDQIKELSQKRADYIKDNSITGTKEGFDKAVSDALTKQIK